MRQVIVTGATGLVGSHLAVELLRRGECGVIVSTRSRNSLGKLDYILCRNGFSLADVEVIEQDLESIHDMRDLLSSRRIDVIFHCAARVQIGRGASEDLVRENVAMTHNICVAAQEAKHSPLMVHVSSIAALGSDGVVDEMSVPSGVHASSAYTRSKFYCEGEVWRAAAHGLRVAVVNPAVVVGATPPEAGFWLPSLAKMLRCGVPFWIDGTTGWVGAEDVARAMADIAWREELHGKRYVLCAENMDFRGFLGATAYAVRSSVVGCRWLVFGPRVKVAGWILRTLGTLWPALGGVAGQRTRYDGSLICRSVSDFRYTPIAEALRRSLKR